VSKPGVKAGAEAEVAPPVPPVPPFIHRLPPELGRELTRLSACDHYVEAHTRRGHALILLRFSDALGELWGADGFQIHRSHWVARDAVRRLVAEGRTPMIELDDGTRLPVSRSRIADVRARVASGAPPSTSKSPPSSNAALDGELGKAPFETGREDAT
jgi:DNA-binding LytR/AlgR family response regulator